MKASIDKIYLNVLLVSSMVQNGMDALEGTGYYKQALKNSAKTFGREIRQVLEKDVPLVWGLDDDAMYLIMEYQEQIIKELMTLPPEDCGVLLEMLRAYKAKPDEILELLSIKKVDNPKEAVA